jgi:hypothetical protein
MTWRIGRWRRRLVHVLVEGDHAGLRLRRDGSCDEYIGEVAQATVTTKGAAEIVLGSSGTVQSAIEVLQVDVSEFFREIAV